MVETVLCILSTFFRGDKNPTRFHNSHNTRTESGCFRSIWILNSKLFFATSQKKKERVKKALSMNSDCVTRFIRTQRNESRSIIPLTFRINGFSIYCSQIVRIASHSICLGSKNWWHVIKINCNMSKTIKNDQRCRFIVRYNKRYCPKNGPSIASKKFFLKNQMLWNWLELASTRTQASNRTQTCVNFNWCISSFLFNKFCMTITFRHF